MDLKETIRDIPDFPKPGIIFKDITSLLQDPKALKESILQIKDLVKDLNIDIIAGAESRGFIFGTALAYEMGLGFVPIRKKGKLPADTIQIEYELEYGTDILEIHTDGVKKGQNVLLIDDLLATGGTAKACADLIEKCGANVAALAFLVELAFLNGKDKLRDYKVLSVIKY